MCRPDDLPDVVQLVTAVSHLSKTAEAGLRVDLEPTAARARHHRLVARNAPMLAANERLGYRPLASVYSYAREPL